MRGNVAFVGLAVLVASAGSSPVQAAPGEGSFEALLAAAGPSPDLPTIIAALVDDCTGEARAIDRARCASVTRRLRQELPSQSFAMVVDDAAAVTASDYDARIKGVRLGVIGCLACDEPLLIGKTGQRRLLTLKVPERGGGSLRDGALVVKASLAFPSIPEAKLWLKQVRPQLRAEFVFAPESAEWSFGPSRGFAFRLLGVRVFNRCTGEVVFSQPASEQPAHRLGDARSCGGDAAAIEARDTGAPGSLSAAAINRVLADLRPVVDGCLRHHDLRGSVNLLFEVAGGTGIPVSVVLEGGLAGTDAGRCLTDAARKLRFPRFSRETQKFSYPVLLRRR